MAIFQFNVAARFVLVLLIGLLFQTVTSIMSLVDLKESMLRLRSAEVQHLLESGYSALVYYHQQVTAGKMTDQQARQAAADVVRNLHYDNQNYYFVWDLNGNGIAHGGDASLENKNFLNGPDAEKLPLISAMVRSLIGGSHSAGQERIAIYQVPKAGQTVALDKITGSRLFEPWGWVIGSGAYVDDIDTLITERAGRMLAALAGLILIAGAVTYYVAHDLVHALRRLSVRIASLNGGELNGDIPGTGRSDEVGMMARALAMLRDTSREVSELKLDHLTGLPTRKLLIDRIRQSKVRSERSGMVNALLLLDLDKFKPLNDTHGHDAGDKLLKEVATRLLKAVRESDTVARLGGDEFVVLLVDLSEDEHKAKQLALRISAKILQIVNQDYYLGHIVHHCTASLGITLFQGKTSSADDLLNQADIAMYRAKVIDNGVAHFFAEENQQTDVEQVNFEKEFNAAFVQNQFLLYYQPQLGIDGALIGCEALIRWQHPTRGLLLPGEFLPLAERKGLLAPLGTIVLELACAQIAEWTRQNELADLKVSVNISSSHFRRAEFVDQLLTIIQRTRIHPSRLTLELSEHVLANNIAIMIEKMKAIRTLGSRFCIDDFGMSYVPLSHLSQLPVQELKVCRFMVQNVFADTASLATPKMILAMARSLGLNTIAVGIETEAQQACLLQAGCAGFQGYLYCEPLSATEFSRYAKHRAV